MDNNVKLFIYIELSDENLPDEQIRKIFHKENIYFAHKGDSYFEYKDGKKIQKIRKEDYCNIRYELYQNNGLLNDILIEFLRNQENKLFEILNVKRSIRRRIHICVYPENEQYTFDISGELIKSLYRMNMEIGITTLML